MTFQCMGRQSSFSALWSQRNRWAQVRRRASHMAHWFSRRRSALPWSAQNCHNLPPPCHQILRLAPLPSLISDPAENGFGANGNSNHHGPQEAKQPESDKSKVCRRDEVARDLQKLAPSLSRAGPTRCPAPCALRTKSRTPVCCRPGAEMTDPCHVLELRLTSRCDFLAVSHAGSSRGADRAMSLCKELIPTNHRLS